MADFDAGSNLPPESGSVWVIVGVSVAILLAAIVVAACLVLRGFARAATTSGGEANDDVEMTTDIVLDPSDEGERSDDFGTFNNMLEPEDEGADHIYGEFDAGFDFGE